MSPEQADAAATKLVPRLRMTKSCRTFCRLIIRLVERPHRRRVAWAAIRKMEKPWASSTVNAWLREKAHTPEAQQKRTAAKRRWKAKRRAKSKASQSSA